LRVLPLRVLPLPPAPSPISWLLQDELGERAVVRCGRLLRLAAATWPLPRALSCSSSRRTDERNGDRAFTILARDPAGGHECFSRVAIAAAAGLTVVSRTAAPMQTRGRR